QKPITEECDHAIDANPKRQRDVDLTGQPGASWRAAATWTRSGAGPPRRTYIYHVTASFWRFSISFSSSVRQSRSYISFVPKIKLLQSLPGFTVAGFRYRSSCELAYELNANHLV